MDDLRDQILRMKIDNTLPAAPASTVQREGLSYGTATVDINQRIRDRDCPSLRNNPAGRKFATDVYREHGYSESEIAYRKDNRDAGHLRARNAGGYDTTSNYMWEDRHANRAHGDDPVHRRAMRRAGRAYSDSDSD